MKNSVKYIVGDVRYPNKEIRTLIIHCCNDEGKMGKGVALAILKKWPLVASSYHQWHKSGKKFQLGEIQRIKVEDNISVVNMIGQHGVYKNSKGYPPIRYDAMEKCLEKVAELALKFNASIACPYLMGCALAGGEWNRIEALIQKCLCYKNIDVTAYDIDGLRNK